jgi:regulator of protease activity HflC (stomatin/prohibitin superfamily)
MTVTQTELPPAPADDAGLAAYALADRSVRLLRWLTLAAAAGSAALAVMWVSATRLPAIPLLGASLQAGLIPVTLASLLLALTGLVGTWIMAAARRRAASPPIPPAGRWAWRLRAGAGGDPGLVGRAARWPQAIVVSFLALAAGACAWLLPVQAGLPPVPPGATIAVGAAAIALAFPLLVAERLLAAMPASRLPEAASLRVLLLLPVLAWPAAGLLLIASGLGLPFAGRLGPVVAVPLTAVAAELCLRALGRCFLPPPAPHLARAAIDSVLARMIAEGIRTRGLAAPLRRHMGIDFSRSWALAYLRAATPPVALLLLVLCWGLSGVVLVGLDQRAVYERFGAPVAVLGPGLHAILPWPMGRVRRLEFGTVHETTLTDTDMPASPRRAGAEDRPPPEADRLWEQAHPGELVFLIAGESAGQQSFQVVSADIRLRYRIGMSDHAALLAATAVADPVALLRAASGRAIAAFFAGRTLEAVLGENREAMAGRLRVALQQELDRTGCGIDLAAVVIEAIHPPAGAAEAYHNVQAAEIQAITSIAAERGHALATGANARQYATDIVAQARAAAAEATGTASADLIRFTADDAAARAGGEAFLLERRLSSIANALAKAPLTIIDHRIPPAEAPLLDLRPPPAAPTAPSAGPGLE